MNKTVKLIVIVLVAGALGGFVSGLVGNQLSLGAASGPAHYQMESFLQGISAGERDQFSVSNAGVLTSSAAVAFSGETVVDGFTHGGGCFATTTISATDTWTEAEMLAYNCFVYSGETLAAAITITLPATSTMTTLIPNAGDSRIWFYDPSAYDSATTTTFVAGTGIIMMEPDEGSAFDVVIAGATSMATIELMRRSDDDVYALITEYSDAD